MRGCGGDTKILLVIGVVHCQFICVPMSFYAWQSKLYIYEYIWEEQWPKQMQRASFAAAASDPEPKEMFELCSKNL